ncbi:MAG: formylglycine-generating enzyme family protein [Myxococcota bacterium]
MLRIALRIMTGLPVNLALAMGLAPACQHPPGRGHASRVAVRAGSYLLGSRPSERALGYALSGPGVRQQGWYDAWEQEPHTVELGSFQIDRTPVTHRAYADFVARTGHAPPDISPEDYARQGFLVHPYREVEPYRWLAGAPPGDRLDDPVVLVSLRDAEAYCAWSGGRLPGEQEWEAACTGSEHRIFPWGDAWRAGTAQVEADRTAPVTAHPEGGTPEGVLDLAGNVFEWTASEFSPGRAALRSCSWDDSPGACRCAFRHGRPADSRHILIGFRCAYGAANEGR